MDKVTHSWYPLPFRFFLPGRPLLSFLVRTGPSGRPEALWTLPLSRSDSSASGSGPSSLCKTYCPEPRGGQGGRLHRAPLPRPPAPAPASLKDPCVWTPGP